ncbi:MAG: alpha/beta fold hydrolase [Parcubacteria group bacterium]|nr:alpha/beta fold hydrolase [Parcubacteria group bacterium]
MMFKNALRLLGIIILGLAVLALWLFDQSIARRPNSTMEKVVLTTKDSVRIVGDFYSSKFLNPTWGRGALLLHMMPATRESWRDFVPQLVGKGYQVLAIDLRGHGESDGGPDGYRKFADTDHQKSIFDVEAGVEFLVGKGVKSEDLVVIGASIGANLALWYVADHSEVKQAVLLSPGLNYRGIETTSLVRKLRQGTRVFFVTSEDDIRSGGNNADMNRTLYDLVPDGVDTKLVVYKVTGHGTDMLRGKEKPDLATEILAWLGYE